MSSKYVGLKSPPLKLGLLLEARLNSSVSGGKMEGVNEVTSENSISCSVVAEGMVLRVDEGGLNIRFTIRLSQ